MSDIVLSADSAIPQTLDTSTKSTFSRTLRLDGSKPLRKALVYVFHRTQQFQLLEGEPMPILDASARTVRLDLKAEDLIYPGLFEVYVMAENIDGTMQRYPGQEALRINVTGETRRYELGMLTRAVEETFRYRQEAETFAKAQADGTVILKSKLPNAASRSGEVWLVVNERSYYQSDGTAWKKVGTAIAGVTGDGELTDVPVTRVPTIADLKTSVVPTPQMHRLVEGYYTPGDGGGGMFVWKPGDTTVTNGGTVFPSTVNSYQPGEINEGRWHRMSVASVANVRWFGAQGDGTSDDTDAIHKAFDFALARDTSVYFPDGKYRMVSGYAVDLTDYRRGFGIFGQSNEHTTIQWEGGAGTLFQMGDSSSKPAVYGLQVGNISFKGDPSNKAGTCFNLIECVYMTWDQVFIQFFDIGLQIEACFGSRFNNLAVWNCRININVTGAVNNAITFHGARIYSALEAGMVLRSTNGISISDFVLEGNEVGVKLDSINDTVSLSNGYAERNNTVIDVNAHTTSLVVENCLLWNIKNCIFSVTDTETNAASEITFRDCTIQNDDYNSVTIWSTDRANPYDVFRFSHERITVVGNKSEQVILQNNVTPRHFIRCDEPLAATPNITLGSFTVDDYRVTVPRAGFIEVFAEISDLRGEGSPQAVRWTVNSSNLSRWRMKNHQGSIALQGTHASSVSPYAIFGNTDAEIHIIDMFGQGQITGTLTIRQIFKLD